MPLEYNQLPSNTADLDEHVARFESWFKAQQQAHGVSPTPLISVEHAILRSYITWLRTTHAENHDH